MMDCTCSAHGTFLTAKGLKEAAQREGNRPEVDGMETSLYLDLGGSVSALVEVEDLYAHVSDQLLLEQSERFHNGS